MIKNVTREETIALWSPFFYDKDVDTESLEFKDLGQSVEKWMMRRIRYEGGSKGPSKWDAVTRYQLENATASYAAQVSCEY